MSGPSKSDVARRVDDLKADTTDAVVLTDLTEYAAHVERHGTDTDTPREYFGSDNWDTVESVNPEWRDEVADLLKHPDGPDDLTFPEYYAMTYCGVGEAVLKRRGIELPDGDNT